MLSSEAHRELRALSSWFDNCQEIVLVTHVNADGDAIGSMHALFHRLRSKEKQVRAFLFETPAERFAGLDFDSRLFVFDPADKDQRSAVQKAELLVILDLSVMDRLPGWSELLKDYRGKIACLDHHPIPSKLPGQLNIIEPSACATGEIIYELFRIEEKELSQKESLGLFTAITTDTGWFRYSNTSSEALAMASDLLRNGMDIGSIYRTLYQSNPLGHVRLLGRFLKEVQSELDGRFLWVKIPRESQESAPGVRFDSEDLLDILRSVKEAECVALFRETDDGGVRVNLRSKGSLVINGVAERFGGGGHRRAAGITLSAIPLDEAADTVVNAVVAHMGEVRKNKGE